MARRVLIARGGALTRASGLGRAHHDCIDRLENRRVEGYTLANVIEHDSNAGAFARWRRRRLDHPATVADAARHELAAHRNSILHITDQEQAHLVPKDSILPVSVTVHDLFHLKPRFVSTSQGRVSVGQRTPGAFRKQDISHLLRGLSRADLLICISEATAAEAREIWPEKSVAVVPHGIDVEGYHPLNYPLPKPSDLDHKKVNLLCVGSEESRKRIDFLIDVLASVPSHVRDDIVLHKVGAESSKQSRKSLTRKASSLGVTLRWVGRISDIDLCGYYQHCDALLFPSVAEGFGLPPLEAMASGCPVRAADMPAHNEVVPAEWLLPHDSIDDWVDAIIEISSKNGRKEPNKLALKRAQEFSIERWSISITAAWNQMVGHRPVQRIKNGKKSGENMLVVDGLTKGFGWGSNRLEVLKGIDLKMERGELVALMGPSGCGKSTLLNIIGGLLAGDEGNISLEGRDYGLKGPASVVDVRRSMIGWIFQDFHLLNHLSALDNVAMALEISGTPTKEAESRAKFALERVGLGDRMEHIPDQLSGGQQQRVAIARAIAGDRPLLLADEPTGNLDITSGHAVLRLFKELCHDKENPISILMVTHDPDLASQADRMLLLRDGTVAASDIRSAWGLDEDGGEEE
jgi:putative ABC transport system ATP-binding protein